MDVWMRILVGGGIGLVGVLTYVAMRVRMETAKDLGWGDLVVALVVQAVGLSLADLGDWVLRPVVVPDWLPWTFIGFAAAVCVACVLVIAKGVLHTNLGLLIVYFGGLFLGLLAVNLTVDQVT